MSSSNGLSAGIVAAITSAIVVGSILVLSIVILIRRRLKKSKMTNQASAQTITIKEEGKVEQEPIEKFINEVLNDMLVRFTPRDLINFTENYTEKLGSGGFGVVYKGQFQSGVQVAVKVLKGTLGKKAEEQFVAEVATIGGTCHVNLVKLYGFCFDKSVKALVYEYMEKGSLDRYLFKDMQIEWGKLHDIAIGTAKGIRYLHDGCQKEIVHYDIKPANVLLTAEFMPKIADFGLARLCDREKPHAAAGARGTPGYAAPELWGGPSIASRTTKCDVYSYGMLLFEVLGRRKNFQVELPNESQEWFPQWVWSKYGTGDLERVMSVCGIEGTDQRKAERMCQVALWCVQYDPEARPSMNTVIRMLEGEEEEIIPPLDPFHYMKGSSSSSITWSGMTGNTSKGTGQVYSEVFSAYASSQTR